MGRRLEGRETMVVKSIRMEQSLWDDLEELGKQDGYTAAQIVRIAIRKHLEANPVTTVELPRMTFTDWEHHRVKEHKGLVPVEGACMVCDRFIRLQNQG